MRDVFFYLLCLAGLAVLSWIATGFVEGHATALLVTALMGVAFLAGFAELRRQRMLFARLRSQLTGTPVSPEVWCQGLPDSVQGMVRQHIEGVRAALPAPVLTPFLTGLLVMLGMLGTFLGMVVTLKGATLALDTTTDLALIRAALAEPIRGLGLSFGTSVAGVAASALLGLAATLVRREGQAVSAALERFVATHFGRYSAAAQRDETLRLLAEQQRTLAVQQDALVAQQALLAAQQSGVPGLVERLGLVSDSLARMTAGVGERLIESQAQSAAVLKSEFSRLAASVDDSLQHSLRTSGEVAGASFRPLMEAAVQALRDDLQALRSSVLSSTDERLEAAAQRFSGELAAVGQAWRDGASDYRQAVAAESGRLAAELGAGTREVLDTLNRSGLEWRSGLQEETRTLLSGLQHEVNQWLAGTQQEAERLLAGTQEASARLLVGTQDASARLLAGTQEESARLLSTLQGILERSSHWVDTRRELETVWLEGQQAHLSGLSESQAAMLARFDAMSSAVSATLAGQVEAIQGLVQTAGHHLESGLGGFGSRVEAIASLVDSQVRQTQAMLETRISEEAARLDDSVAQAAGGALEMAALAQAFSVAVGQFGETGDRLLQHMATITTALEASAARSDDQLAYYVAQAREIIDLTLMSQKQLLERLPLSTTARTEGAEA